MVKAFSFLRMNRLRKGALRRVSWMVKGNLSQLLEILSMKECGLKTNRMEKGFRPIAMVQLSLVNSRTDLKTAALESTNGQTERYTKAHLKMDSWKARARSKWRMVKATSKGFLIATS